MTEQRCGACGAQSDMYLCTQCTTDYQTELFNAAITYDGPLGVVHCLLDELDVMLSRQTRMGRSAGYVAGHSQTQPLPFDGRASNAREAIERAVMHAYRLASLKDARVVHGPRFAARLLVGDMRPLLAKPGCTNALRELQQANADARAVIDRPPDRWYAGMCSMPTPNGPCPVDLYAQPNASVVQCPGCHVTHDVAQRRATLLNAAEDVLATAHEISRAVTLFGESVTAQRIYEWRSRSRLLARGVSPQGQPLYRVGDVLSLARASVSKRRQV